MNDRQKIMKKNIVRSLRVYSDKNLEKKIKTEKKIVEKHTWSQIVIHAALIVYPTKGSFDPCRKTLPIFASHCK